MKLKVVVHEAEEGGYWAEVPSIQDYATEGDTFEDLLQNIYEAVEGCLSVDLERLVTTERDRVLKSSCEANPGRRVCSPPRAERVDSQHLVLSASGVRLFRFRSATPSPASWT